MHVEIVGRKVRAEAPEAGDHLVEDQQDVVLVADLAEPTQVALGRHEDAGGARHGLHDHCGNGGGVVQRRQPLQVVRQMRAPLGLAAAEGLVLQVVGVADMIDAGQQAAVEHAVLDDAADGGAAEIGAVIAALAPDEAGLRALAPHIVIAERDLERGVGRFRARVGEEHVVEIAGREIDQPVGELEGGRVAELEGRRKIHALGLRLDRRHDLLVPRGRRCSTRAPRCRPGSRGRPPTCNACPWRASADAASA